jgi:hypothetical protein
LRALCPWRLRGGSSDCGAVSGCRGVEERAEIGLVAEGVAQTSRSRSLCAVRTRVDCAPRLLDGEPAPARNPRQQRVEAQIEQVLQRPPVNVGNLGVGKQLRRGLVVTAADELRRNSDALQRAPHRRCTRRETGEVHAARRREDDSIRRAEHLVFEVACVQSIADNLFTRGAKLRERRGDRVRFRRRDLQVVHAEDRAAHPGIFCQQGELLAKRSE